jgi:hypothetical protein
LPFAVIVYIVHDFAMHKNRHAVSGIYGTMTSSHSVIVCVPSSKGTISPL